MSMVLEAEAARATERAARDAERLETERLDVTDALEEIIASHRAALVELAPRQAARRVREETAWHITDLGLLLRVRDRERRTQNPAPSGVPDPEQGGENTGTDRGTR